MIFWLLAPAVYISLKSSEANFEHGLDFNLHRKKLFLYILYNIATISYVTHLEETSTN